MAASSVGTRKIQNHLRDRVTRFFGEGVAFLTGELVSAFLGAAFFAGAFLAGVALAFLAGAGFAAFGVVLAFLAGDSFLGSAAAFLFPLVGFSTTGVSTLTGVSTFLAPPRVAFLAGVALAFGAALAPPLVFFTGASTVSGVLGASPFSGDSFLAFLEVLPAFTGVSLVAAAGGAFWPLAFLGGLAAGSSASGTGEGSIFLFPPRPPRVVFAGSGV